MDVKDVVSRTIRIFRSFTTTNAANKARGEWIQYRSVENEDTFT
jgi:hypothetical protein